MEISEIVILFTSNNLSLVQEVFSLMTASKRALACKGGGLFPYNTL